MFDIVFRRAEIFDGTGSEGYIADVAIENGKIVKVGTVEEFGASEIEADGLSLAPGFIDVHTHSDSQLFVDPSRLYKVRQGVTTEIGGQCGWSRGPSSANPPKAALDYLSAVLNGGAPITLYPTYTDMINAIGSHKLGANQLTFVGHHVLRGSVIGMESRKPTADELEQMKALLDSAMREGAPGFSSGIVYAPGCYCEIEELIELAKVIAPYGGIYTTHIRDEADKLPQAVGEAIRIAKEAGVTVNISHMKAMFTKNLPLLDEAIAMIEQANREGCNIFFDVYPYDASSATILSTLPPSYLANDMDWLIERLSCPEGIAQLEKDIMQPTEVWENPLLNAGFDHDMIAVANATPDAVGKTIHDYAQEKGMSDVEAYAYIIAKNHGNVQDIRFVMSPDSLSMLYAHPLCGVGTDGLYTGFKRISHPRHFGTFPRYLGRFIREQKVLPFGEGIRRITGLAADRYGLTNKGYIKPGFDADLVLFDKNRILDHSAYANPFLPNEGVEMVFVAGQAAVVANQPTGVCNGTPLLYHKK